MSDNTCTLIGNVTKDPELRFTQGGRGVCNFGLAVNRRYQVNGEWQEETSFFNVVAWGTVGENAAASLTKGSRAIVTGRMQIRSWDKEDGTKGYATELVADDIGASLRWARVEIERITRSDSAGSQQQSSSSSANRAPDPVYGDEPPF